MSTVLKFEGIIPAHVEGTFMRRPADHFRPRALHVLQGAAECELVDLRFGNRSQFSAALPAACFPPNADDTRFTYDAIPPNVDATLVVYNHADEPVAFEAELTEDPS